jgi:hypothetical protein
MDTKKDVGVTQGAKPTQRHIEIRPSTAEEIQKATAEGAVVLVLPPCACEVKSEVFGHLIIV